MIIFIVGMQRSGSTFSFNIAREIVRARGTIHQEATNDVAAAIESSGKSEHILVKSHDISELGVALIRHGSAKAVCTVRKPEEAIASWLGTFGFGLDEAIEDFRRWLEMYRGIAPHALTIDYETIDRWPMLAAWRIARHLGLKASPVEAFRASRKFRKADIRERFRFLDRVAGGVVDLGFSHYDQETFFHRRHVSPEGTPRSLAPAERARIRNRLASFLDSSGNVLGAS